MTRNAALPEPAPGRRWRLTPPQLLALVYALGILLGAALLHLPGVQRPGAALNSIDLLFTATSAICITGLTVADTGEAFTRFGQVLIILLVQIGGLGILTFGTVFAFMTGRRVNFTERQHLVAQLNALDVGSVLGLVRTILLYTFVTEALGAALLALRFVPQFGWGEGLYQAAFHAVSAYNNGGFVVLSGGLAPYAQDPLVCLTLAGLVILGGLGFLVQLNVVAHLRNRRRSRLLVYSKLTLLTTAVLLTLGTLVLLGLEWNNPSTLARLSAPGKLLAAFFQSMTPRSAGFSTVNIEGLQTASLFTLIGLMYIGAGSGSTGGGIKTSTLAILVGSAWNMVRGRGELILFERRVMNDNLVRAGAITTLYTLLVATAFFAMLATNPKLGFTHLLFETVSAAATVGLSMNTTHKLNDAGLLILTALMYLGRIGPLTFAVAFNLRPTRSRWVKYPPEHDILVG
ncbi:TrkH family potassium uptake protein [Deinococcus radiodurans]|jgi:potassium uptake protein, TrkH family|uniref:Potassium uptake protein KtrB n=1 Tax=Deinococcus radiodurans (strain ATCC 13939 / DSM 20539 / JCM 16871 / CCUG 27074 / LMG 4051 / NBRC 15346 / NCIMB 9279 / VKM B-1422 / R1) TaxID=243230 RepID=Q9RTT9_DEIRA|nr:TrkH family potassium uptake protein [Deinococcus radiodurans]AAF11222.1 potassium uptake protein KtrB [Deinococcus radiodurans R1 = ATCC 13939 = DSM 20539]ANC71229.1 potassium transporter KtrB [Deinococcus radiodurans R1 = ATCC 13939 = DSM 20539]QEM71093.1 potassium transporter KtrB [Deinococcus radiodurans]QIP31672.1 potassium transporter KtrB [Deinococcus radiodurans]UDL00747.1 potassium transporter KtrB [Deinococcus radiodurans R1 = ATCC 13939 = DSM 20539]